MCACTADVNSETTSASRDVLGKGCVDPSELAFRQNLSKEQTIIVALSKQTAKYCMEITYTFHHWQGD